MNKFFIKALVLATVNIAFFANAQFNNRNRMDKLESFDEQNFKLYQEVLKPLLASSASE